MAGLEAVLAWQSLLFLLLGLLLLLQLRTMLVG
jgi:hypothetical protein